MVEKLNGIPEAYAEIEGIKNYPEIHGTVYFYEVYGGTIVMAEIYGLPDEENEQEGQFFGFHVHEGKTCTGDASDPLKDTGGHYNPDSADLARAAWAPIMEKTASRPSHIIRVS